jgi:hypothetical protein
MMLKLASLCVRLSERVADNKVRACAWVASQRMKQCVVEKKENEEQPTELSVNEVMIVRLNSGSTYRNISYSQQSRYLNVLRSIRPDWRADIIRDFLVATTSIMPIWADGPNSGDFCFFRNAGAIECSAIVSLVD